MTWLENLLIIAGILLDVFAAMEIQGAMIAKLKKRTIFVASVVVAASELVFYFGGYAVCRLLAINGYIVNPVKQGEVLAVIVLALLGIRLILKALKREFIQERRREALIVFDYIRIVIVSSFYTTAAGCACGLVGNTVWQIIALILAISVLVVLGGLYTGMHFGFEKKTIAYIAGALLLWAAGVEIFLSRVVDLI
ncbi:Putative Mn2+ efflux pump MntP [Pseudobutyrivibrio sp. OR37]|uniref:manganese efflux pump n=1 Tax=Pseudobutyrivibrio sp. OR37 TaxID=1798186 RepID=UPI0008E16984|nr:manganese efflux pump [Pseudobutyrivibrio sp. OR37]SFI06046.1 Putative Mn2+ efflux pump MntP [Pseudobutyrivibrio sp. OR37]